MSLPLRTAVRLGADEDFELAKATLSLNGDKLYSEVWNDQPPLHTFLTVLVMKWLGASILGPRLLTTVFAVILIASLFLISRRYCGKGVATVLTTLLIASPGFLELSASCMLEIPSLATALAALCLLAIGLPQRPRLREAIAGGIFGAALLMKLVPVILSPLAMLIMLRTGSNQNSGGKSNIPNPVLAGSLFSVSPDSPSSAPLRGQGKVRDAGGMRHYRDRSLARELNSLFRTSFPSWSVFGAAALASFTLLDLAIENGAYLAHFGQSWVSHFGVAKAFAHGSAADHPFDWSVLAKNWDTTVPALLGVALLLRRIWVSIGAFPPSSWSEAHKTVVLDKAVGAPTSPIASVWRVQLGTVLPLTWLVITFGVFGTHKPWWPYYYIHTAIPLCWCAATGITSAISWACPRLSSDASSGIGAPTPRPGVAARSLLLIAFVAVVNWDATRVWLQISGMRKSPRIFASPVIPEMVRFKPYCRQLYADQPIYSFHSGIPMVRQLAVMPSKRFWAGEMTNERLVRELAVSQPGLILLSRTTQAVPFQQLLDSAYRIVYYDPSHRLYAHKLIATLAD
jgi:hypothetical protein